MTNTSGHFNVSAHDFDTNAALGANDTIIANAEDGRDPNADILPGPEMFI
jgi:hypothetical protein